MATIGDITGSSFIGCPITVPVTSATVTGSPTFRRVRLKVTVTDTTNHEFEFATPVSGNAQTVEFDVSSALRAVAEQYEYQADPSIPAIVRPMDPSDPTPDPSLISYPTYTMKLDAYDDYMIDGQSYEGMDPHTTTVGTHYCAGKLTDRERLSGSRPSRYSRKPTTGTEIIFIGSTYVNPGATSGDPTSTRTTVAAGTSIAGTYVTPFPTDGYEMRFINSLGIHESLCLRCLRDEETNIKTTEHVVAKQETLTSFSRSITQKQDDREVWQLSSGALDQAWLRYYIHEVLMAEVAWLKVNGLWLPIEILPDESVVGVDRAKANMLEVKFKVKFGINGSPW